MDILNELSPEYITDKKGKKKSVILPIEKFEELLEDIEDLAAMAERREEPTIPHDEVMKYLQNKNRKLQNYLFDYQ